jgi:hypothetical protein
MRFLGGERGLCRPLRDQLARVLSQKIWAETFPFLAELNRKPAIWAYRHAVTSTAVSIPLTNFPYREAAQRLQRLCLQRYISADFNRRIWC